MLASGRARGSFEFSGMASDPTGNTTQDLRCPAINGLPEHMVHMLHHSLTELVRLRRGLETTNKQIEQARQTALSASELLRQLRLQGF